MKTKKMNKAAWIVLIIPLAAFISVFQNCSNVAFQSVADAPNSPNSVSGLPEKSSEFAEMAVGQADVPPLKLIFIVDNSYTMQANQISLASAFGKMFAGTNATNLAPFESTAYVFNTAQASLPPGDAAFGRLPTLTPDALSVMNYKDLETLRGASVSDGKFAGDLAGYAVNTSIDAQMMKTYAYVPSPVMGLNSSSTPIELGVHKTKNGSVADFSSAFTSRINLLNPARSAFDSTGRGILDAVVDRESGLCALARVLKNNSKFLKKGDLAAYVIVSDEDDSDPSGSSCVDSYVESKGEDLISGKCSTDTTVLKYHKKIDSPTAASCKVSFVKGFTYKADWTVAGTDIAYYKSQRKFTSAHTLVKYNLATYKTTSYSSLVDYYTATSIYKVPRTTFNYYTKSQSCQMRDGLKVNCVDVYASKALTVDGNKVATCSSDAKSVVPSDAVFADAAHPISCVAATSKDMTGACSGTDQTITDCTVRYDKASVSVAAASSSAVCADIIKGKLPANAVLDQSAYAPKCAAVVAASSAAINGHCAAGAADCKETLTAATKTVDVEFTGSNCSSIVTSAALASNASVDSSAACEAKNTLDSVTAGDCTSALPSGKIKCDDITPVKATDALKVVGVPGSATCQAFAVATNKMSSAVLNNSAYPVVCSSVSLAQTASLSETYSATNYSSDVIAKDTACPASLTSALVQSKGDAALKCQITGLTAASQDFAGQTCSASVAAAVCSSSGGKYRSCDQGTTTPAGAPYEANFTTSVAYNGTFSCESKCSDTTACSSISGSVKDQFKDCEASVGPAVISNPFTGVQASTKASLCTAPNQKLVIDSTYKLTGTAAQYVAGAASPAGDQGALAKYIKSRSVELLGAELPAVSVFVRQASGGSGGTEGKAYKSFASDMGGVNNSVEASADTYASSLQKLSGVIREKLSRSISISTFKADQKVLRVWFRAQGSTPWIEKTEGKDWTASGGTLTISQDLEIKTGDEFRAEFK